MQPAGNLAYEPPLHCKLSKIQLITFLSVILAQVICILVFAYEGILFVVAPLLGILFLKYTALSVEKTFYFLVFYIIIFEEYYYAGRFAGLPIYFSWPVVSILVTMLALYWIIHLVNTRYRYVAKPLDVAIAIFVFLALMAAINGYLRGYDGKSWRWDVLPYYLYSGYFIFTYSKLKNNPKFLYYAILFLSVPVALEMIVALIQSRGAVLLQRIVTQNIHIMQFSIPFAGLSAIYASSRKERIVAGLLLPIFVVAVLISQQRALMLTIFLTLIALLIIYLKVKFASFKQATRFLLSRALITIALVSVPFILIEIFTKESLMLTIVSRFYIFLDPTNIVRDPSWQIRWQEIIKALPLIKENLILGAGLGATTISRHRLILQITLDNSYIYILWKMGILGLISFLSVYYLIIKRCVFVLKSTEINQERVFSIAVLINTVGLLIVGMTNVCIAHYRFIFVWLAAIAGIETIARKYD